MTVNIKHIADKTAFLIAFFFTAQSLLGVTATWNGTQNRLWTNSGNWLTQYVPSVNDAAVINRQTNQPLIPSGIDSSIAELRIGYDSGKTALLTLDGGTMNVSGWAQLGCVAGANGQIDIEGGCLTINANLYLPGTGTGTININGGKMICYWPSITANGKINITNGIFEVSSQWNPPATKAHIDSLITAGLITAFDGNSRAVISYTRNADTNWNHRITAQIPDLALAWNPSPADGSTASWSAELIWQSGQNASSHELYLGTNPDEVAAASHDSSCFKGSLTQASYKPCGLNQAIWYWRVDEKDSGGMLHKGPVWSFTVPEFTSLDDFETYATSAELAGVWSYQGPMQINLDADTGAGGYGKSLRMDIAGSPEASTLIRRFQLPQDWAASGAKSLVFSTYSTSQCDGRWSFAASDSQKSVSLALDQSSFAADGNRHILTVKLDTLESGGLNLSQVAQISLTFTPSQTPLPYRLYIDDIRLYPPIYAVNHAAGDINDDCRIDIADIIAFGLQWLRSDPFIDADINSDMNVNFGDFTFIARDWRKDPFTPSVLIETADVQPAFNLPAQVPDSAWTEIPFFAIPYGPRYFFTTGWSRCASLRPGKSILTDADAFDLQSVPLVSVSNCIEEGQPRTIANKSTPWRYMYYGTFSAEVIRSDTLGKDCVVGIVHGENVNSKHCCDSTIHYDNTVLPPQQYIYPEQYGGFDQQTGQWTNYWPAYFAFVCLTYAPIDLPQADGTAMMSNDQGPIVWPANGYVGSDGKQASCGVRHPSSIIDNGFLYVFFVDESTWDGNIRAARCPVKDVFTAGNFKLLYNGSFSSPALPEGFRNNDPNFFYKKPGPSTALFNTHAVHFAVAKLKDNSYFIGIEERQIWNASGQARFENYLRLSRDLINWSHGTLLPYPNDPANGPGLGYAKFFNADFTDNKLIDPDGFYVARSYNPAIGKLPVMRVKIDLKQLQ